MVVRELERKRLEEWLAAQSGSDWEMIQELWEELSRRLPELPPPAAGPGEDERARLSWSRRDLYVELEAAEDGTLTWYARDHRSQVSESGEVRGLKLPMALMGWLERVGSQHSKPSVSAECS